jgi:hypothetical protein
MSHRLESIIGLVLALLLICTTTVTSFPNGAGGCLGGMAAVGGSHLDTVGGRPVTNNTLLAGGVEIRIGNTTLDVNAPLDVRISANHTITVASTQFPIRGVLIRLEAPDGVDTTFALTPGSLMQNAVRCVAPIIGTTHINNTDKPELTSTIRFDESVESIFLDITGVFINNAAGSVYVYSRYVVNFVSSETLLPSASPISGAPTKTPTIATLPPSEPTNAPTTLMPLAPEPTNIPLGTVEPSTSVPETQLPSPQPKTTPEPSLRGGMEGGMMSKSNMLPTPSGQGMGMGKGGVSTEQSKGMMMKEGKGMEKHNMKRPKEDNDKHPSSMQMEMR